LVIRQFGRRKGVLHSGDRHTAVYHDNLAGHVA
jgi:hypothetical protein